MAINSKTGAVIGGALFGAYTSDVTENPLSGVLSTGVGAAMGAFMQLPEASFKEMSKVAVGPAIDMELIAQRKIDVDSQEDFTKMKEQFRKIVDTSMAEFSDEEVESVYSVLKKSNIDITNDRGTIIEFLKQTEDPKLMKKIGTVLKNSNVSFVNVLDTKVSAIDSYRMTVSNGNEAGLISWFTDQLGNSPLEAEKKAKMFLARAAGGDINLKDGTISFVDNADGKRVDIPLTSYMGENRFHYSGNGNYQTVSQYNPYGLAYLNNQEAKIDGTMRKITAQDVIKGYDPEMMISHLDSKTPISSILPNIKSLFHYESLDSGASEAALGRDFKPVSQSFINSQGYVNLNFGLNIDQYGEVNPNFPFKKLNKSSEEGLASERVRLIKDKLGLELDPDQAAHLFDTLSMNDLTTINTKGFNSLAAFAPNERNETGVGNRGVSVVNKNAYTQTLENLMGQEHFNKQFSSSQILKKLDIVDHELFNEVISNLYGNDYVLSDGGGFFNIGSEDVKIRDHSVIKLPVMGVNELAISNPELAKALTHETGLGDYLRSNPISIGTEALAYTTDGEAIGLNKMYTSGLITDGFIDEAGKEIRLSVQADFDGNIEKNMKFYSTGTKSLNTGIKETTFNMINEIGLMINEGTLKVNEKGQLMLNNTNVTNDPTAIKKAAATRIGDAIDRKVFTPNHLIGRAEDTGMSDVVKAIDEGLSGNAIYDTLMSKGGFKGESALTAMLLSETKASVDLTTTLAMGLKEPILNQFEKAIADANKIGQLSMEHTAVASLISKGFLTGTNFTPEHISQQRQAFNQHFLEIFNAKRFIESTDKDAHLQHAYNLVRNTNIVEDYKVGKGFAIGSMNKGMSIVGAGNRARMSWNAISNLRSSGFSTKQLELFGHKNSELLYEVRSTIAERTRSKASINDLIFQKESSFISMINKKAAPENRFEFFRNSYGDKSNALANNPFLSYNLTLDDHEIKSINFSRISTKRSGFYEGEDGVKLLKQLDQKKIGIVNADIAFRESKTVEERAKTRSNLTSLLNEYVDFTKSMYSGSNNLLKSALSLESSHSDIMQVKGIGGNADRYATSMMKAENGYKHIWFISEEEALDKAKQIGAKLEFKSVNGYENIKTPVFTRNGETIPLASILTREPAQGPLSSDLVQWHVDTTISKGNRGNAFVPLSNMIYYKGMFGDMDQDTVQTLLGNFQKASDFNSIEDERKNIRSTFIGMKEILENMKVKGNKQKMKTLTDFETFTEYAQYRISSALKGRNRKTLAAPATGLAVAYSKALELEFSGQGVNNSKLLEGRILSHQVVENLIKSAHLNTDTFSKEQEQSVEKLTRLRNGYVGKPNYERITRTAYEAGLREELPKFLNIAGMPEGAIKEKASLILENMITSELNHSTKIGMNPFTPMDLAEHRYSKDSQQWINALTNIVKSSDITETDYESGMKNLRKSSGQVALGIGDLIADTFKNNKMVIGGGLAAMAGIALLGRSEPSFSDSRSSSRQYAASMLRSPGEYDAPSTNNTPMGIETNTNKSGYLIPKSFNNKGIRVSGDFINQSESYYNSFNSMIDTNNIEDQAYNVANAAFGNGIRSARLQTN